MNIDIGKLTRLELAAYICQLLHDAGINVVLSGGSVVSIYSSEHYVSVDLDFIDTSLKTQRQISMLLKTIGFENFPKNSRHFTHPDTPLTIEFPSAPLMVGDEFIPESNVETIKTDNGTLKLLSATDCVKDRLAGFYYFGDQQCFEQALLVAKTQSVDFDALEKWHNNEGQPLGYKKFLEALKQA